MTTDSRLPAGTKIKFLKTVKNSDPKGAPHAQAGDLGFIAGYGGMGEHWVRRANNFPVFGATQGVDFEEVKP